MSREAPVSTSCASAARGLALPDPKAASENRFAGSRVGAEAEPSRAIFLFCVAQGKPKEDHLEGFKETSPFGFALAFREKKQNNAPNFSRFWQAQERTGP